MVYALRLSGESIAVTGEIEHPVVWIVIKDMEIRREKR